MIHVKENVHETKYIYLKVTINSRIMKVVIITMWGLELCSVLNITLLHIILN